MSNNVPRALLLKYGIPCLAIVVIVIHLFFVNFQNLTKWKGGGYGMYTGIHFYYDDIYIPGLSVDSLILEHPDIKEVFRFLKIMPNEHNLKKAAKLVLKKTKKDSILIQYWKPTVNSKNGVYSRVLFKELYVKNSDL